MNTRNNAKAAFYLEETYSTSRARSIAWSDGETATFLELWKSPSIQKQLTSVKRNHHVYTFIANQLLKRYGVQRTVEECKTRLKSLKQKYFQYRQQVKSGRSSMAPFPGFCLLDDVLSSGTSTGSPLHRQVASMGGPDDWADGGEQSVSDPGEDEPEGFDHNDSEWQPETEPGYIRSNPTHGQPDGDEWPETIVPPLPIDRGVSWTEKETELATNIWARDENQHRLRSSHRNVDVFTAMAQELGQHGYMRTANQCRTRIKMLKRMCRKAKSGSYVSGLTMSWRCMDTVARILEEEEGGQGPSQDDLDSREDTASSRPGDDSTRSGGDVNLCTDGIENGEDDFVEDKANVFAMVEDQLEDNVESGSELGGDLRAGLSRPFTRSSGRQRTVSPIGPVYSNNRSQKRKRVPEPAAKIQSSGPETFEGLPSPSAKRQRLAFRPGQLMARFERLFDRLVERFITCQTEMETRRLEWEERRHFLDLEDEVKRRREQRDHELRMFEMMQKTLNRGRCCCQVQAPGSEGGASQRPNPNSVHGVNKTSEAPPGGRNTNHSECRVITPNTAEEETKVNHTAVDT